ncbi:MAG: S1 RNA-binding domain-containing protein [Deltaproteobacteria bacterium]|nr:S1 RNA-binding domain-containing protein [Deltaproteobacteria bacterium]
MTEEKNMEMEEELSFAELLEANPEIPSNEFVPGDTVSGAVVSISKETIFVDLDGKSEGIVDRKEFLREDGSLTVAVGDRVELKVASLSGGIYLSKGLKIRGAEAVEMLREAHRNSIPVEGKVAAEIKGGFEVEIASIRAFCPISQIDLQFCENPEEHIGARYAFHILEFKEKGRNIILSRRSILKEEQERKARETLAILKPDRDFEGKITKLKEFGAFVDIGGIEGMLHVSEISHSRIKHPSDILQKGQMVKVKVLKIEQEEGGGRQRISLSMKALEPDAWEKGLGFKEGDVIPGKVAKLTDFGAFVEVAEGVEGLVHISEISYERISHASAVLKEGDTVDVLIMGIDHMRHRISLSIKEAEIKQRMEDHDQGHDTARLEVGQILMGIAENSKPYGLFVRLPQLGIGVRGLLPAEELRVSEKGDVIKKFPEGKEIQVEIVSIDEKGRIRLSLKAVKQKREREEYVKYREKLDTSGKLGTLGDLFKGLKR